MAERFVTYMTEDAEAGKVPVNGDGVLDPAKFGGGGDTVLVENVSKTIVENKTSNTNSYGSNNSTISIDSRLVVGKKYKVVWDGTEYMVAATENPDGITDLDNDDMPAVDLMRVDKGHPCNMYAYQGAGYVLQIDYSEAEPSVPHTVSVYEVSETLDSKYLPKAEAVANASGETVTSTQFNNLLTSLRNAGYLAK